MKRTLTAVLPLLAVVAAIALVWFGNIGNDRSIQLLNVSYDPTREPFQDLNRQFVSKYERETRQTVTIKQSHGGSSSQARAVIAVKQMFLLFSVAYYTNLVAYRLS